MISNQELGELSLKPFCRYIVVWVGEVAIANENCFGILLRNPYLTKYIPKEIV